MVMVVARCGYYTVSQSPADWTDPVSMAQEQPVFTTCRVSTVGQQAVHIPGEISQTAQLDRRPDRLERSKLGMETILRSSSFVRAAYVFSKGCGRQTASKRLFAC